LPYNKKHDDKMAFEAIVSEEVRNVRRGNDELSTFLTFTKLKKTKMDMSTLQF
jgi:hypothetical protein